MNLNTLIKAGLCVYALAINLALVSAESEPKGSKAFGAAKADKEDKAEASGKSESKSKSKSDGKAESKSDGKTELKSEAKSEAKSEGKSAGKTDSKSEGKIEAKVKTETKGKAELGGSTLIRELTVEQLQEALSNYRKTGDKLKIDVNAAGHRPAVTGKAQSSHSSTGSHGSPARAAGAVAVGHKTGDEVSDAPVDPNTSRDYIKARAAALTERMAKVNHGPVHATDSQAAPGHGTTGSGVSGAGAQGQALAAAHWGYEGAHGPQAWAQMKPEFGTCATGKRQSPIHIEDTATLQGPAEPLQINYLPSGGTVVNNGHTIQVDVTGENTLTVRGSTYKLIQFHAHHPAEERVNNKSFSMVIHLVHRSNEGKLAVVAVLLDPGQANPFIQKVWTHMPLDVMDKVRMPAEYLNLTELLPLDRRYYQFMGSLTTPPCTEGVLWMVLKQPVTLSREQLRVFAQLFPNNARPVQPLQGRVVRNAE